MFAIKIERNTRQWIGTLAVGIFVAVMIFTGKIPAGVYQHWEGLLVGALFYHIVKMLNAPAAKPDHIPDTGKMVSMPQSILIPQLQQVPISDHIGDTTGMVASAGPDQFRDATKMISPATPPQATQESPQ